MLVKHKIHLQRVLSLLLVFCMVAGFVPSVQPAEAAAGAMSWKIESYKKGDDILAHTCPNSSGNLSENVTLMVTKKATATEQGTLSVHCSACGADLSTPIPTMGIHRFDVTGAGDFTYDGQEHTRFWTTKAGPFQDSGTLSWPADLFFTNNPTTNTLTKVNAGWYTALNQFSHGLKWESDPEDRAVYLYDERIDMGDMIIRPATISLASFPQYQFVSDGSAVNNIMTIWRNITIPGVNGETVKLNSYFYPAIGLQHNAITAANDWTTDKGANSLTSITQPGVYLTDVVLPSIEGEKNGYGHNYQFDDNNEPTGLRFAGFKYPCTVGGVQKDVYTIGYRTAIIVAPKTIAPLYVGDSIDTILQTTPSNINGFQTAVYPGDGNQYANITQKAGTYSVPLRFVDPTTGISAVTSPVDVEVKKYTAESVEPLEVLTAPVGTALEDLPWPKVTVITEAIPGRAQKATIKNVPAHFAMSQGEHYDPYTTSAQTVHGWLELPGSDADNYLEDPNRITFDITVKLEANNVASYVFEDVEKPYTGQPIPHEISKPVGIDSATYVYEGIDGTSYGPTDTPPTDMGNYLVTATLTMGTGFAQIGPLTAKLKIGKGLQYLPSNAVDPKLQASDFTTITLQEPPADPYGGTYEYGIIVNGEPQWQDDRVFRNLEPNTSYDFVQRLKETTMKGPSPASNAATFRTRDFEMTAAITANRTAATVPQTVTLTASCSHSFGADASVTLSYQWFKNGIQVSGETGETLTLSDPEQSGFYSCQITLHRGPTTRTVESNQIKVTITAQDTVMKILPENWQDYLLLSPITYGQKLSETNIRIDGSKLQAEHPELNQALYLTFAYTTPDVVPTVPSSLTGVGTYDVEITFLDDTYTSVTVPIPETKITVNPAPLTITVGDLALTYGDDPQNVLSKAPLSYNGFVNGDTSTSLTGNPIFTSGYTEQWKDLPYSGSSFVTMGGLTNPNYDITITPGTVTFRKLMIEVGPTGPTSKVYGDSDPYDFGIQAIGISDYPDEVQAKIADGLDYLGSVSRQPGEDVNVYSFLVEDDNSNQNFNFKVASTAKFYINPKPVEVTWEGTDNLTSNGSDLSGNVKAYYLDKDGNRVELVVSFTQGGSAATLQEPGTYIAKARDTSAGSGNYAISGNEKAITVKQGGATEYVTFPTASDITHGQKLKDSTLQGGNGGGNGNGTYAWKDPEFIPSIGTWSYDVVFTPSADDTTDYTREQGYNVADGTIVRQVAIKVTQAPAVLPDEIKVTTEKTYDGTTNAAVSAADAIQIQPGDDVTVSISATYDDKNAGDNKTITVHVTLSGPDASKYSAPEDFTVRGSIRKAPLKVSAQDKDLVYGDELVTPTLAYEGFVPGDTKNVLTGHYTVQYDGYQQWDDVPDAPGQITVSMTGTERNYEPAFEAGTYTVAKRPVTVRPSASNTKVYGDADPTLQFALEHGLQGTIPEIVQTALSDAVQLQRDPGEDVGSYPYRNGAAASKNFDVTIDPSRSFTITKKPVTLTWVGTDLQYEVDGTDQGSKISAYITEGAGQVNAMLKIYRSGTTDEVPFQEAGFYDVVADLGGNYEISNPKVTVQMLAVSEHGVPDPSVKAKSETSIELNPITNGQYSIDNGTTWQDSPLFEGLTPDTVYPVKQRIPDPANEGSWLVSNPVQVRTDSEPEPIAAPVIEDVGSTTVTVKPIANGQYSIDDGKTWQDSNKFTGLMPETAYEVIQRVPHPSKPGEYLVSTATPVTTLKVAPPQVESKTSTSITLVDMGADEYSIDDGETWQTSRTFTGLTPNTTYQARQAVVFDMMLEGGSKKMYFGSEPTAVTTDPEDGPVTVPDPVIQNKTHDSITVKPIPDGEYSIDGGTTWQDSSEFTGLEPETEYEIIQRIPDGKGGYVVSNPVSVTTDEDPNKPVKPAAPIIDDVKPTSLTVRPIANGEYSVDGGRTWQPSNTFTGLTPKTTYEVRQRIPDGNGGYLVSDPTNATTPADGTVEDTSTPVPVVEDITPTTMRLKAIDGGEYSIDGGKTWQASPSFTGLTPSTRYSIIQRKPSVAVPGNYVVSQPTVATTPSLPAPIDVPDPIIDNKDDTSVTVRPITNGEYSIDNGATWQPSNSFTGLTPDTTYQVRQRVPDPNSPGGWAVSDPVSVKTDKTPEPGDNKPAKPVIEDVTDTTIMVKPIPDGEYSIDGGKTWQPSPVFPGLTPDTTYDVIQRIPDPNDPSKKLVSDPTTVKTDPAGNPGDNKPAKPVIDNVTDNSVEVRPIPDGEYSIDGGKTWQESPVFPGLEPDTDYEIIQRIPDPNNPDDYLVSDPTTVTTDPVDMTIPKPIVAGKTKDSITLMPIPDGEYSVDGGETWQRSPYFPGLTPDTEYEVKQRQPVTGGYKVSESVTVKTDEHQPSTGPDIKVDYPNEVIEYDPDPGFVVVGPGGQELLPGDKVEPGDTITIIDKETGDEKEITLPDRPNAPDVKLDTKTETINTKPGMEYSPDGGKTWIPAPGGLPVGDLAGSTILVRYPATDGSFSSEPTEVEVPARENGPAVIPQDATGPSKKDGALVGTDNTMEYSPDGGRTWYDCANGSTGNLAPGSYLVRYKATEYTLASRPTIVTIGVKPPSPILPPTTDDDSGSGDQFDDADRKYGHFVQPGRPSWLGSGGSTSTDGPATTILDGDVALSGISGCPSEHYVDVDQSQWYHDAVDFTVANRLMVGFNATEWGPTRDMTRYQMVQVLYRLAGSPAGYTLTGKADVTESHWAYKALAWAYSVGVIKGVDATHIAPDASITYEQMATMIYNFCNVFGLNYITGTATTEYDRNEVSDYAQAPMTVLSATGIFNTHGNTSVSAKGTMTRATAAQVITNFCALYNTQFQTNEGIKGTTQATYTNPGVMDNATHVLYT